MQPQPTVQLPQLKMPSDSSSSSLLGIPSSRSRPGSSLGEAEDAAGVLGLGKRGAAAVDDARIGRRLLVRPHLVLPRWERRHERLVLRLGRLLEPAVRRSLTCVTV